MADSDDKTQDGAHKKTLTLKGGPAVGARPGLPDIAELTRIGVVRVSSATRFATLALSAVDRAAWELRESGRFDCLAAPLTHPDMQHLFDRT